MTTRTLAPVVQAYLLSVVAFVVAKGGTKEDGRALLLILGPQERATTFDGCWDQFEAAWAQVRDERIKGKSQ